MRLDKFLTYFHLGSRKEVREIIKKGEVCCNEVPCYDPSFSVNPTKDEVKYQGERLIFKEKIYLMLNKPAGFISATTSCVDKTVLDLLPPNIQKKDIFPAGRLDKDTEGLILLTNDGQLSYRLLNPKRRIFKKYYAEVEGLLTERAIEQFAKGFDLRDDRGAYRSLPAKLEIITTSEEKSTCYVYICEGRFHQVKKMLAAVETSCLYLKRIEIGSLVLDNELALGEIRELTQEELNNLQKDVN